MNLDFQIFTQSQLELKEFYLELMDYKKSGELEDCKSLDSVILDIEKTLTEN